MYVCVCHIWCACVCVCVCSRPVVCGSSFLGFVMSKNTSLASSRYMLSKICSKDNTTNGIFHIQATLKESCQQNFHVLEFVSMQLPAHT